MAIYPPSDENMKRASKSNSWSGERNPNAKLKDKEVKIIKILYKKGVPIKELAEIFNLPLRTAYYAVKGWKHLNFILGAKDNSKHR